MIITQHQPLAGPLPVDTAAARVLFVQAGDYREAFERLAGGGPENYFAQRFTVDYVGRLRRNVAGVAVLSNAPAPYAKTLGNGVLSLGLDLWGGDPDAVVRAVEAFAPTHLILRVPLMPVLGWICRHHVPTLALFAESFAPGDPRKQDWYAALRAALNQPAVRWIANHRVPAARSLAGIGVSARKIIPYDFEAYDDQAPAACPAKTHPPTWPVRLLYVGALRAEKGLPEAIRALRLLRDGGLDATLTIAGGGDVAGFEAQWRELGLAEAVHFSGVLPNEQVIPVMRQHDVVLVTSRPDYPEGFPLTITEALEFFQIGFIYLHAFAKFSFSLAAMVYFSPLFGSVAVAIGVFTVWVIFKFDKPFIRSLHEVNEGEHAVSSNLFDGLSNIRTVITLRLEKRVSESLMDKGMAILPAFRRNVVLNEWKWFSAYMLVGLIYVVMLLGYAYEHYTAGQTFYLGGLVTLIGFVTQFTSVFHDVAWLYTQAVQYNTDVRSARSITEASARWGQPLAADPVPDNWQAINVEGLYFRYGAAGEGQPWPPAVRPPAGLNGLSLRIRRGQRIAVVGRSGSGKSTLLAVLRGLYFPREGVALTVDGNPVADWGRLAGTVTLIPQEPEVFENTIRYNITLGLPCTRQEVERVCQLACFDEVLAQLPSGLDTNIQEKGVNLSGGQKQRLAMARGLLAARGSTIVLLDEPTSSLDHRTEVQTYENLLAALAGKTVIASLHNLQLLNHFDYVYVLHDGQIVEEGSPADLQRHQEAFSQLRQVDLPL